MKKKLEKKEEEAQELIAANDIIAKKIEFAEKGEFENIKLDDDEIRQEEDLKGKND